MSAPPLHPLRRSGFTLIELLAVMLLIITVLAMGVPAMFAAERKSYVNQAMNELVRIHRACADTQREIYSRGLPGVISLTISQSSTSSPKVAVTGGNSTIDGILTKRLGCTPSNPLGSMSINSDDFIAGVNAVITVSPATYPTISWSYEPQTGFISDLTAKTLVFQSLPKIETPVTNSRFRVARNLIIYPFGPTEVP